LGLLDGLEGDTRRERAELIAWLLDRGFTIEQISGSPAAPLSTANGIADLGVFADAIWIVNSRNTADEDTVRTLTALAGFTPHIAHQIDSLDLVENLILDGHGVSACYRSIARFVMGLRSSGCRIPVSSPPRTRSSDAADPTGHRSE
jgi:hypothetical protein